MLIGGKSCQTRKVGNHKSAVMKSDFFANLCALFVFVRDCISFFTPSHQVHQGPRRVECFHCNSLCPLCLCARLHFLFSHEVTKYSKGCIISLLIFVPFLALWVTAFFF